MVKLSFTTLLLVLLTCSLEAENPAVEYKRSFFSLGAAFSIGDAVQPDNLGYGFSANAFQYLDPSRSSGFYYGFFASFVVHSVGGVQIADTRLALLGWKAELISPWLGIDMSLSPVMGARTTGTLVQGSAYVGICPAVGFYVRFTPAFELGLSYQPVVHVFNFGGADGIRNKAYHDIVLSMSFTSLVEVKNVEWE
jgi:hypothetical protein